MQTIDLITPLENLASLAQETDRHGQFGDGYRMGIRHALELARIQQMRIELIAASLLEEVAK